MILLRAEAAIGAVFDPYCKRCMCAVIIVSRLFVSCGGEGEELRRSCVACCMCSSAASSGDEGASDREALDSEEDDFEVEEQAPGGRVGRAVEASDEEEEDEDDNALFDAVDKAMARKAQPASGSQDNSMEEGLEDDGVDDEDL